MWLAHGQPISSQQIETIVSLLFTPQDFASLSNAITWAATGRKCLSLPSFTERVNVKDGGIDAEWQMEFPDDNNYSSPLLGPGWNVFQYKQRNIIAQDREKIFASIKIGLEGAIDEIYKRTGRHPDRYVFFTNLDLTHFTKAEKAASPQKEELRQSILRAYDQPEKVHVEIVGAAELSSFLNSLPHLRSAFFTPTNFATWQKYYNDHRKQKEKLFGTKVKLIGREKELTALESMVHDQTIRAIILSGPHNIGKTRLAIEATSGKALETVFALDAQSMSLNDLIFLETPNSEIIVVLEDPDPDDVENFINQSLARSGLKLLITIPTLEKVPLPNFGRDDRVQTFAINPLSETESQALLRAANANFDYSIESWVIHQAGGNPGILLLAANLGADLKRTTASFLEDVAGSFRKRIAHEFGDDAIDIIRLLSLLTHVGVEGKHQKELEIICSLFGDTMNLNKVLNELPKLIDAGIVQKTGSYIEILPPIFANYLAGSAIQGRYSEVIALFSVLPQSARLRLIRRLQTLKGNEVSQFWDEFFGPRGVFIDFRTALNSVSLLRLVAGAVPERAASLFYDGLKKLFVQERLLIRGDERRELMWALDELLFRKKTSAIAIRCLGLLAEAENEKYGNNATGVFCECFIPLHPQIPLPLQERLILLKEIISSDSSIDLQLIAVKAIESALGRTRSVILRRSTGPDPLDSRPDLTYDDVYNYIDSLGNLLIDIAESKDQRLSKAALMSIPNVLAECCIQGRSEVGVAYFAKVVDWVITKKVEIPISRLTESLKLVIEVLKERRDRFEGQAASDLKKNIDKLSELLVNIDKSDFPTRLKRWSGDWTREADEPEVDKEGRQIDRGEKYLKSLAKEAVESPEKLTEDLLAWLCTEAKKGYKFFSYLGKLDHEKKWLPKIEEIATDVRGAVAFSEYLGGLGKNDRHFVNRHLNELTKANRVAPEAILYATGNLGGDLDGINRMQHLIENNRINPVVVKNVLICGGWIKPLSPNEFLKLLKAIAGPDLKNAGAVIDFFGMWLHQKKAIEHELAEFAWLCLESAPIINEREAYSCDELAIELARSNVERGFALLEKMLRIDYKKESWDPTDVYRGKKFWIFLHDNDRKRFVNLLLAIALENEMGNYNLIRNLREALELNKDGDILLSFALQSEKHAELVCECIDARQEGFWPVALKIIEKYPANEVIQKILARGVEQIGRVISGPYSLFLESCRKDIEKVLQDPSTLSEARPWLERLESSLRIRAERELISEADRQVNDLRYLGENSKSPERIWAISTLIRQGKIEKVRKILPEEELKALMKKIRN